MDPRPGLHGRGPGRLLGAGRLPHARRSLPRGALRLTAPPTLRLHLLAGRYAVCRLEPGAPLPAEPKGAGLWSATRTAFELSVVCPEEAAPPGARVEAGWRCLSVVGPLPFWATGIMAALAGPLAAAGISIFALATFDTDHLLVQEAALSGAVEALERAGHRVDRPGVDSPQ